MVYQYKINGIYKTPAQIAGEVCAQLENSPAGLTPKSLLDASRDKNAPLHDEFEWNDTIAAERYREKQAGDIIRNICIVRAESFEHEPTRAFVNIRNTEKAGTFRNIAAVMDDSDMREKLMTSAKREMQSFIAKYRTLEALSGVIAEMMLVS